MKLAARKRKKLTARVSLISGISLALIFGAVATVIFTVERSTIKQNAAQELTVQTDRLHDLFAVSAASQEEAMERSLNALIGSLNIESIIPVDSFHYPVKYYQDSTRKVATVAAWMLNDEVLTSNHPAIKELAETGQGQVALYQQIPGGFVSFTGNGPFISARDARFGNIRNSETWLEYAHGKQGWYTIGYRRFRLTDGRPGVMRLAIEDKGAELLQAQIENTKLPEGGFVAVFDRKGKSIIQTNTTLADAFINSNLPRQIRTARNTNAVQAQLSTRNSNSSYTFGFADFPVYGYTLVVAMPNSQTLQKPLQALILKLALAVVLLLGISLLVVNLILRKVMRPLQGVRQVLAALSKGHKVQNMPAYKRHDEIGDLTQSLEKVVQGVNSYSAFSAAIGAGQFDSAFEPLSKEDILGNALLEMRRNLQKANEEDGLRSWVSDGQSKIAEIIRRNQHNMTHLAEQVLVALIKYIKANQGILFVVDTNTKGHEVLRSQACYAYDRRKHLEKEIMPGEGLAGQAMREKDTLVITDVPHGYVDITSGLGQATPTCVLVVPLIVNEKVQGVIELATFENLAQYEIGFVEKVAEIIGASLNTVRMNQKTRKLLEDSQEQAEMLRAAEEEMRQNNEELQATQETLERRAEELRRKDAQFQLITSNVPGMIFQLQETESYQWSFEYASEGAKSLLGIEAKKVMDYPAYNNALKVIYRKETEVRLEDALEDAWGKNKPLQWEGRVLTHTNAIIWVQMSATGMTNAEGTRVWNGVLTNITSTKTMQERIGKLLNDAEVANNEIRAQEEELRQNIEEMQAVQEQLVLKQKEVERIRESEKARADAQIAAQKRMVEKIVGQYKAREEEMKSRIERLESGAVV